MTTRITVHADHGWPVRVTTLGLARIGTAETLLSDVIVPAGSSQEFHIWDGLDLRVHEMRPGEVPAAAIPPPDP